MCSFPVSEYLKTHKNAEQKCELCRFGVIVTITDKSVFLFYSFFSSQEAATSISRNLQALTGLMGQYA